jgi:hypothetical protein
LIVVKPDTLIRWHRNSFQLLWRWKSRPRGRPRLPADILRTGNWHHSARVPGLDDSVERGSPPPRPPRVGRALQSRASTREPGTGHSRWP